MYIEIRHVQKAKRRTPNFFIRSTLGVSSGYWYDQDYPGLPCIERTFSHVSDRRWKRAIEVLTHTPTSLKFTVSFLVFGSVGPFED